MKNYLSIFALLLTIACSNMKNLQSPPLGAGGPAFDKQGHRGCRGLMPENTIPAMKTALDIEISLAGSLYRFLSTYAGIQVTEQREGSHQYGVRQHT